MELSDLSISGQNCKIYKNDGLASRIDSGTHLIDYFETRARKRRKKGDAATALLVDRFDGRCLLEEYEHFYKRKDRNGGSAKLYEEDCGDVSGGADELNFERFGVLPEYELVFRGKEDEEEAVETGGTEEENNDQEPPEISEKYPINMVLPKTARQYNIMKMTSTRAAADGGTQFEVLLKVKQKNNTSFSFLLQDHMLHPFYRLMKENTEGSSGIEADKAELKSKGPIAMGLSAIANYSSSSDDEDSDECVEKSAMTASLFTSYISSDDESGKSENEENFPKKKHGNSLGKEKASTAAGLDDLSMTSHNVRAAKPQSVEGAAVSREEVKASRLRRAREMKKHFNSKMKVQS